MNQVQENLDPKLFLAGPAESPYAAHRRSLLLPQDYLSSLFLGFWGLTRHLLRGKPIIFGLDHLLVENFAAAGASLELHCPVDYCLCLATPDLFRQMRTRRLLQRLDGRTGGLRLGPSRLSAAAWPASRPLVPPPRPSPLGQNCCVSFGGWKLEGQGLWG